MNPTLFLIAELVVLFMGVSFLVTISQRRLGPERIRNWMGGRPLTSAVKGIAVGFITPFCTYSAIPLLVGLRMAGVPPAGYVAFISAAPVLDPILFGALWLIVGPTVAVIYLAVTFTAAVGVGLLAQRVDIDRHLKPAAEFSMATSTTTSSGAAADTVSTDAPGADSCATGEPSPWRGWPVEATAASRSSVALLRTFGPLLLLGVGIGLLIEAVVSPGAAAELTTGNAALAIPTAALVGTPLYFSTELFVPIADSLREAGVGSGAIVALTIAGAGANLPEFIVLSKMARAGAVAVFCSYVFSVAMVGGALAHWIGG